MAHTVDIVGQALFRGDCLPKGARNWRRALFATPATYEILSLSASEVVRDAVAFSSHENADPVALTAGPDGRLWRRASRNRPLTAEAYARELSHWATGMPPANPLFPGTEDIPLRRDPIATACGPDDEHRFPDFGGLDLYVEEDFRGAIRFSDKPEALARRAAASRHIALIEGEVHYSAYSPAWRVSLDHGMVHIRLIDRLPGFTPGVYPVETGVWRGATTRIEEGALGLFDATRLDDAKAWAELLHPKNDPYVAGKIRGLDAIRPDERPLDVTLHGLLPGLLSLIDTFKDQIDAEGYATWGKLAAWGRTFSPYSADEAGPSGVAAGELVKLRNSADGRMLPADVEPHLPALSLIVDGFATRTRFENEMRPSLADEAAIAAIGLRGP